MTVQKPQRKSRSHDVVLSYFVLIAFAFSTLSSTRNTVAIQPDEFEHSDLSFYRDEGGTKQRIKTVDHWQKRREQILEGMQSVTGRLPKNRNKNFTVSEINQTSFAKFDVKTISITVASKSKVIADVYIPKASLQEGKTRPAVLALHPTGSAGKKLIGGMSPKPNRQYANELAERGYVVIAPDYPSFGDLTNHDFEEDQFQSGTMQGIVNHLRCVDYLEGLPGVDKNRLGVIGHSLGGHNAIFAALFDPRLKVVASSCGWTPFHDYYGGKIAGWTSDRYMPQIKDSEIGLNPDKMPFDFYELVAALAPRPFLSISPIADSNFDYKGVQKAIPKAKQIYALFDATSNLKAEYPNYSHDFPTESRQAAYQFIDDALNYKPTETSLNFAAELPRFKPLSPNDALKSFNSKLPLTLVAAEPLVTDPVAMSFDAGQRLYVVEMKDYSEQDKEMLGQVRLLYDDDKDGLYDRSTIFADKLSWPTAITCYDDGVFVGAAPDIFYLKDGDGDGVAEIRKKVFTGFGRGNVQGLMNCFRWGLDNRIHGATSSSGGKVYRIGDNPMSAIDLRGRDFSFDPKTLEIRAETGGGQHGMCFDDLGSKFVCSNSDHAQYIRYDGRYTARNPHFLPTASRISIATDGGQAEVFRDSPVEPWRIVRTRLRVNKKVGGPVEGGGRPAGYFTGATGITIYRGDAGLFEKGTAIIGDVGSNIVHRKKVARNGLNISASRLDQSSEMLTSTDNWFRPVQFANAPDGCLYVLDMYREVIEHPLSLPPEIKQHLDLTSGKNRGRIYRMGTPRKAWRYQSESGLSSKTSTKNLVGLLNSQNSWQRETAARLLYEQQDQRAIQFLQTARVNDFNAIGRIHALWSLHGMKLLKPDDFVVAVQDIDPQVVCHAIHLAELTDPKWLETSTFSRLAEHPNIHIRLQLAFSIGTANDMVRKKVLWRLMKNATKNETGSHRDANVSPLMLTAIMSSANGVQYPLLVKLISNKAMLQSKSGQVFMTSFVEQMVKRNHDVEISSLIEFFAGQVTDGKANTVEETVFRIAGIRSKTARRIVSSPMLYPYFKLRFAELMQSAVDVDEKIRVRLEAIRLLQLSDFGSLRESFTSLLKVDQPIEIQLAALDVLCSFGDPRTASILLLRRSQLSQQMQHAIRMRLMSRSQWTVQLLEDSQANQFAAGELQILSKSSNKQIKRLADQLLKQATSPSKDALIRNYQKSLSLLGTALEGKKIFEKHCANCHRASGIGFEIGPNLAAMKSRGKAAILSNVLDPNREVNPSFNSYIVQLDDGRNVNGMITNETSNSITLTSANNKAQTVSRDQIEAIKNSGLSLMPEGLEKDISVEQMADLLEFLMSSN